MGRGLYRRWGITPRPEEFSFSANDYKPSLHRLQAPLFNTFLLTLIFQYTENRIGIQEIRHPFAGALSTDEIQHLRKLRLERSRESLSCS